MNRDEAHAFNAAVAAFDNWAGESEEPEVFVGAQSFRIGAVCNFAELFNEPMPDGMHESLCRLAAKHSAKAPDSRSYVSGARCLRALRDAYLKRLEDSRNGGSRQRRLGAQAPAPVAGRYTRDSPSGLPMPIEFTEDERAALIDLLVGTIERHPFPQSPDVQRLRGILRKIRPVPELPSNAEIEENDLPDADKDAQPRAGGK